MKNVTTPTKGKILSERRGAKPQHESPLKRRADEVAMIEDHREVTGTDAEEARRERRGEDIPPTGDVDEIATGSLARDPSEPAVDRGHQIPNYEGQDEEKIAERLVLEGVEEADHDQMVAARHKR